MRARRGLSQKLENVVVGVAIGVVIVDETRVMLRICLMVCCSW